MILTSFFSFYLFDYIFYKLQLYNLNVAKFCVLATIKAGIKGVARTLPAAAADVDRDSIWMAIMFYIATCSFVWWKDNDKGVKMCNKQ